jgi:protein-S-isoprenylcysteine O-methyltransferase Ste14
MKILGHSPINPFLFVTGKVAGYAVWLIWVLSVLQLIDLPGGNLPGLSQLSFGTFGAGIIVVAISLFDLGSSTSLGLPEEETQLKTTGLYRISRNPMYVGFHLFTVSAILYTLNILVALAGVYSIVVYHFIIRGEERFLAQRFGDVYEAYRREVRRYL